MIDVDIEREICSFCEREHGWVAQIDALLRPPSTPLPANDDYWRKREEMLEQYKQSVVDFSYDDGGYKLCAKHLKEVATAVEEWVE